MVRLRELCQEVVGWVGMLAVEASGVAEGERVADLVAVEATGVA